MAYAQMNNIIFDTLTIFEANVTQDMICYINKQEQHCMVEFPGEENGGAGTT